ncbi:metal-dependent hydrolase [Natronosalvus halobius]|uniref:metal-dependent hydrolase n=1 Tax=Natronosalvus halobius TaxID=2953746 RepID=UPI0020A1DF35|nr:metal-dependent hydrolase [Natronosalvus halobius]USZ70418.1 metal-dependent hydrolase [Natronosalvus halobius]
MMLPTHAFAGMVIALPYALAFPEFGPVALLAGFLGGIVPDLDLYAGHRKTLHYPVYYSGVATLVVPIALLRPTLPVVVATWFLVGAALHSVGDVFGGGLELRPWEATSNRAVYDHHNRRWIAPLRWVRYDGAPEDLALSVVLAVPLVVALEGALEWLVIAFLGIAVTYTAVRRMLPAVASRLLGDLVVPNASNRVLAYVPARYLEASAERGSTQSR